MTLDLHKSTFEYLKPTEEQLGSMEFVRREFASLSDTLSNVLPPGPDKTYLLRKLRECAMWANVTITRNPDGTPRT